MRGFVDPDLELVLRCQANRGKPNGARCLDGLLRRYHERIAGWCLRVLRDREDAADCTQEVLLRISRGIRGFHGDSSFAAWVYSLTRRACATALEQRRRRESRETTLPEWAVDIPSPNPRPLVALVEAEANAALHRMLAGRITPIESSVLVLHHVDGLSMRAITEMLSLSNPSGAKAFLASAKRKLRERWRLTTLHELGVERSAVADFSRFAGSGGD